MKMLALLPAAALVAAPAAAADRAAPTGKWTVGLEERGCTLFREFSSGGEEYSLHVTPDPATGKTELVVLHKNKVDGYASLDATLLIDGGEDISMHTLDRFPRNSGWARYGLMIDDRAMLRKVDRSITIEAGRILDLELTTGAMAPAIAALETCVAEEA